jgi:hypothetical protein
MWNEFLPISMPITAILLLSVWDMACSFVFGAPCQFGSLAGLEHGRTIPFSDLTERPLLNSSLLGVEKRNKFTFDALNSSLAA